MAIPQGFRNVLGIATPVCGLVRNDRGVPKQTDKSELMWKNIRKINSNTQAARDFFTEETKATDAVLCVLRGRFCEFMRKKIRRVNIVIRRQREIFLQKKQTRLTAYFVYSEAVFAHLCEKRSAVGRYEKTPSG